MTNQRLNKYKNLSKIMQLPGTTMDKKAKKQMGEYAKQPENFLKDVNEMMSWSIECSNHSGHKPSNFLADYYFKKITEKNK